MRYVAATSALILLLPTLGSSQERDRVSLLKACFDEALNAASTIKSDYFQSKVMSEIAEAQGRAGWAKEALETIEAMTYEYYKSLAYAYVGRELGKAGKITEAREVLEKGMTSTDESDKDFKTGNAYGHIAVSFARLGDFDRAIKLASATDSDWGPDSFALKDIAMMLAQTGDVDRAIKVAPKKEDRDVPWILFEAAREELHEGRTKHVPEIIARIEDPSLRDSAQVLLVETLASAGRLDEADLIADSLGSPERRIEAMAHAGVARAKAGKSPDDGRIRTAESLLDKLSEPRDRVNSRLRLARWKAALKDPPGALKQVEGALALTPDLEAGWETDYMSELVTRTFAEIGADDRALELAGQMRAAWKSESMLKIAIVLAQRGSQDKFEAVLARVSEPTHAAQALFEAGRCDARRGAKEGARKLMRRSFEVFKGIDVRFRDLNDHRNGTPEWSLLHDLLEEQAQIGDFEGALATALKGVDEQGGELGGNVVRVFARFEAKAGRLEQAKVWIRKLKDPIVRSLAFTGAAEGLIEPAKR